MSKQRTLGRMVCGKMQKLVILSGHTNFYILLGPFQWLK